MTDANMRANARAEAALGDDAIRAADALLELDLPRATFTRAAVPSPCGSR